MEDFIARLPEAICLTVKLTIVGFVAGQFIALVLGSCLHLTRGVLHNALRIYPFIFRGTPLLIQLFIIYYGVAQITFVRESFLWVIFGSAQGAAMLALTLNVGAYSTILVYGALKNLPKGQVEASSALGISRLQTLLRIEVPQAYRHLLPSLSNEIIFTLKGSALASTITIMELTGLTRTFIAKTYSPFEYFPVAGLVYLAIGFVALQVFRILEKRLRLPGN
ncbi:ABC transporter permease subunit [Marinovum sp. 2_MG-2023]|uniref:ABC transporter permease n=1 Tax=unclassified Marinovum TaxID=2647166 RepID=UPI0026E2F8A2|nr:MULTISPECIES: ABC transporter permease subunit [unclassified Marinovum]MDO6729595.1 ABC transporter permease subunit [Marinovum sp. 2_MG-2023]MDO6780251.1 ABC transporter permease subunit [Marinovum sp. 1_MG-2023]